MGQPTVQDVWHDPDFQGLPIEEKRKVLADLDPDFSGLPAKEQDQVLGTHTLSKLTEPAPAAQSRLDVIKAAARQAVTTALPSEDFNQPLSPTSANPVMGALQAAGQTLRDPTRIAATTSLPGQKAGDYVSGALQHRGVNPLLSKGAGFVTSMALDPNTYTGGGAVGKAETGALGATANVVGEKVLAPFGEVLSATRMKDIVRLFKNPKEVLFAPSLKESGDVMGVVEKALGVTDDEMRLIAKAADRATGGSRTVVEGLIQKGKDAALQAGDKPENWAKYLSPGELIAGRRGASKLSSAAKGRETFIAVQDLKAFETAFVDKAKEKALTYLQALKQNSAARTRAAFLNVVPLNKNMSGNALRGMAMVGEMLANPLIPLAHMPLTTGAATLLAKGVHTAGKAALNNPVAQTAMGGATLKAIQSFLARTQRQPGS